MLIFVIRFQFPDIDHITLEWLESVSFSSKIVEESRTTNNKLTTFISLSLEAFSVYIYNVIYQNIVVWICVNVAVIYLTDQTYFLREKAHHRANKLLM